MGNRDVVVRVKAGAADWYLQSAHDKYSSSLHREEVAQFLRNNEGKEFRVTPVYRVEKVVAYALNDDWCFLPEDVEVITKGGE